jgi:hypothetical protein
MSRNFMVVVKLDGVRVSAPGEPTKIANANDALLFDEAGARKFLSHCGSAYAWHYTDGRGQAHTRPPMIELFEVLGPDEHGRPQDAKRIYPDVSRVGDRIVVDLPGTQPQPKAATPAQLEKEALARTVAEQSPSFGLSWAQALAGRR